uniref:Dpy-19 like C-mannosyltransferase 3 n=1 Tax=Takifugu rubripes TaxID=31033 RepID=A0A674NPI6_TAKRU
MTSVRQRKGSRGKESQPPAEPHAQPTICCSDHQPESSSFLGDWSWKAIVWAALGLSVSVGLGLLCCIYVATLHENDLWFSNIKEVEREISFRTECGLYYSYFKQMLQAPSVQQGLFELTNDNLTESKRTINLLQRMNIYQEVFLSVLYRFLPIQSYLEPVYFYIYTVFSLQAVYVIALYLTAWLLSGSWLAGALAGVWYILNRVDTTRVEFTISLRENWSLPFLALQVAAITCYLRPHLSALQQKVMVWLMYVTTFSFCLTWQFNQFILLVQALVIYTLDCLDFLTTTQPALKTGSLLVRLAKLLLHTALVLLLTSIINYLAKTILQLRSDEHIYKFIKSKFGLGLTRDFDAGLYLCEEAFGLLPLDTLERLAGTLLLHPYGLALLLLGGAMAAAALHSMKRSTGRSPEQKRGAQELFRPDVAYNLLHTLFYGLLAFSTMRMKYIWTGHMCVVAAYGVCGKEAWTLLLGTLRCNSKILLRLVRCAVPLVIISYLYYKFWPVLMEEVSELREFYDPDTVELMTWISTKTPQHAVFAGSMQLLAGIKLCTGRVLTNHPHYEDKDLRERTQQVYQVYAQRSPEEVHAILRAVGADYVVLENSICYERRHRRGCRLRDLLDLANGHIMDGEGDNDPDLVSATHPRFCEAIKSDAQAYAALFTRTFQNKTFHVYRVKKKRKKSGKSLKSEGSASR